MRKIHLVALALAMFAFFAVAATSASAEDLLWLVNGEDFEGTLGAETEGLLELLRLNKTGGEVQGVIHCEGVFDGTITNPHVGKGTDTVTKVLTPALPETGSMEDVGADNASGLTGPGLDCQVTLDTGDATFCKAESLALVWPANLPWKTELELMSNGQWLDLFGEGAAAGELPGYEVECTVLLGIKATDLCEGLTSVLVLEVLESLEHTVALGSHGEFNSESEFGLCKTAGNGTELIAGQEGLGVTWATEGDLNRLETDVSETP
jgi:hypothetical protein